LKVTQEVVLAAPFVTAFMESPSSALSAIASSVSEDWQARSLSLHPSKNIRWSSFKGNWQSANIVLMKAGAG